jgi:hypothetical protein
MPRYLACADVKDVSVATIVGPDDEQSPQALLVAALDGSDSFASKHGEAEALRKAEVFQAACAAGAAGVDGETCVPHGGPFCDGAFIKINGDDALHSALAAALAIHRKLSLTNLESQGNWTEQVHARIAIATSSWDTALTLLPQAMRGETVLATEDSAMFTTRESLLLSIGSGIRIAAPGAQMDSVIAQLDDGIELPGDHSDVARLAQARIDWWQTQLRQPAAAAATA